MTSFLRWTSIALALSLSIAGPLFAQQPGTVSSTSPLNKTVTIKLPDSIPAGLVKGVPVTLSITRTLISLARLDTVFRDSTVHLIHFDTLRTDSTITLPPAKDTTTKPVPVDTTKPPVIGGTVLASINFNDGTYGALTNNVPGHNAIVDDPANSGRGKVLQVRFDCSSSCASADLNQYISYFPPNGGVAHGQSICINADVLFPANTPRFADGAVLRKLTYFWLTGHVAGPVYGSGGTNANLYGSTIQNAVGGDKVTYGTATLQAGVWTHLQILLTMNSKPGATDGAWKVWVNGKLTDNLTNVGYTTASQSASTRMQELQFGAQREGASGDSTILEYHDWDNFVFSTACAN